MDKDVRSFLSFNIENHVHDDNVDDDDDDNYNDDNDGTFILKNFLIFNHYERTNGPSNKDARMHKELKENKIKDCE